MKTIWKYTLLPGTTDLLMPYDAEVLSVHEQCGAVCLWALVDASVAANKETRTFLTVGTGMAVGWDRLKFIGTSFVEDLVFHTFEVL